MNTRWPFGRRRHHTRQRGAAMAATVIALPVLGALIGSAIQLALLFQAKATLNHAALQAARSGMVNNASFESIVGGLARGLAPLYNNASFNDTVFPDVVVSSCVRILNPTIEATLDHGGLQGNESFGRGIFDIKHDELSHLPAEVGSRSGVSIQDANLLKIHVVYGVKMVVPIIGPLFARALSASDQFEPFDKKLLGENRMPIMATATVRTQSDTFRNDLMVSRSELSEGPLCTNNLLPSFLNFNNFTRKTQLCLIQNGADFLFSGGQACFNCAFPITKKKPNTLDTPPAVGRIKSCIDCLKGLSDVANCFFQGADDT